MTPAEPQSAGHRRRGFLRRHRIALSVLLVIGVLVVVGMQLLLPAAQRIATQLLQVPVSIGFLSINPLRGVITGRHVTVGPPNEHLSIGRVAVNLRLRSLLDRQIVVERIDLGELSGTLTLDADYRPTLRGLVPPTAAATDVGPPRLTKLAAIVVTDSELTVQHVITGKPQTSRVHITKLAAKDLAFTSDGSTLRLTAQLDGALDAVSLRGSAGVAVEGAATAIDIKLDVRHLRLPEPLIPLPHALAALSGEASGKLAYKYDTNAKRNALQLSLQLDAPRVTGAANTSLVAKHATLDGVSIDFANNRIDLGQVRIEAPNAEIALTAGGLAVPGSGEQPNGAAGGAAWTIAGGTLVLDGGNVTVRRGESRLPVALDSGRWSTITSRTPGALELKGTPEGGGSVVVTGTLGLDPLAAALDAEITNVAVAEIAALYPELPLRISRGTGSARLAISSRDTVTVQGSLQLHQVHTAPPSAEHPDQVLACDQIEAQVTIDPSRSGQVEVPTLIVRYPYVMVQRLADAVFPYTALSRDGQTPGAPPPDPAYTVHVGTLEIVGGRGDFVDRTVTPPYWTGLADVHGTVHGLTLPTGIAEAFELTAKQDEINPVRASGTRDGVGWNIRARLDRLSLPALNAYMSPIFGYKAESGLLSLEAKGRVSQYGVNVDNTLELRDVALEQTGLDVIQRDTGVPLPVALGLMKDLSGKITLDIPLQADMSFENVRLGSVVSQVVSQALVGTLASPLRLLGMLFGTKGPPHALAIDPIPFAVGTATLSDDGQSRIAQIARILQSHADLTLVAKAELSAADAQIVGDSGLAELARARTEAVREAFVGGAVQPSLAPKRLVIAPWARDPELSPRSDVYVELQPSANYR